MSNITRDFRCARLWSPGYKAAVKSEEPQDSRSLAVSVLDSVIAKTSGIVCELHSEARLQAAGQ